MTGADWLTSFTFRNLLIVAVIFTATWLLVRWIARIASALSERAPRARFLFLWLEPAARILLWFAAAFLAFDLLLPSRETFLAAIGSIAIAIGLGAQDLIRNLIGGLVILADRPYQVGDRVRIGEAYGEVVRVGLRSTKIITPEETLVTIPNLDILTSKTFDANSGQPECQVVTAFSLPPDTDPDVAMRIGREAAITSPYTLASKPVWSLVSNVFDKEPYLRLTVRSYVYDHRFEPDYQSDITRRITAEARRLGLLDGWQRQ